MRNKLTNRSIQKYYDSVLAGLITMDEFFELAMILPTRNLYKRNSQIINIFLLSYGISFITVMSVLITYKIEND